MRRIVLGVVGAGLLGVAGVVAQSFPVFTIFTDTELSQPCTARGGLRGPAAPLVFQDSVWMVFTCNDDAVILRRYASAEVPPRVNTPPPPVCPAGFVLTWDKQGCVTPDHPAAGPR